MAKVNLRAYDREIEKMIDRGQLDEAIAHCHHIFKTFPKHLETYRLLGKAYLEYKRHKDAADIFSRVLTAEPNDFVSNVGMSIIRDEENKLDDAIWHMERAFESQPSNSAIQSELQRLYGRRDGVQPPRIRMTRGALAHMYVQGELYPQAISEIKSVLKEDPGRSDMEVLLARAHYRSGQKNEAADAASRVLRRYPHCLDANRVLAEIIGADRPENAQAYRQRVVELDPYASQVAGSIFLSNDVPDAAVSLEQLDWNGQPVGTQDDWRTSQAIGLESGAARREEPDWLKNAYADTLPPTSPSPTRPVPALGSSMPPASPSQVPLAQPTPAEDIPDFLRAAGWGQSTGAFDESKPVFGGDEPAAQPLAQGDLPDWVKAMAPPPAAQPAEEEEMPDWMNKIGTGQLSSQPAPASGDQPDWMSQLGAPSQASTDQLDWMTQLGEPSQAEPQASTDQPDWMSQVEQPSQAAPQASLDQPDWMSQLEQPSQAEPQASTDQSDWMHQLRQPLQAEPQASTDQPDWMSQLDQPAQTAPQPSTDFDFLNQLSQEPQQEIPSAPAPATSAVDTGSLGASEQERDDSFAWLENLAAKQGASEGLLTKPEERMEEEPDWVKQAKGLSTGQFPAQGPVAQQPPHQQPPMQAPPPAQMQAPPPAPPSASVEELGKSEQERDDSFAWLENLAAKQGASEGLLTKPEERMEQEPEWVKQAKDLRTSAMQQPVAETPPPVQEPSTQAPPPTPTPMPVAPSSAGVEELGKSEQERDDSFAWLENLAAKQGASEGLLTKPEERMEQEPDWVRQAKDFGAPAMQPPASQTLPEQEPPMPAVQPSASVEELGKSEQERDDSFAWLENLAAKQGASEGLLTKPEERMEQEPEWVRQAKEFGAPESPYSAPAESFQQPATVDDTTAWLRSLDQEEATPPPASASDDTAIWLKGLDQKETTAASTSDDTAIWLKSLEREETTAAPASAGDDTAMWLKSLDEADAIQPPPDPSAASFGPAQDELPAWMQNLEEEKAPETGSAFPASDIAAGTRAKDDERSDWVSPREEPVAQSFTTPREEPKTETGSLPSWLRGLGKEQESGPQEELPAWLRDETGEKVAEPTKIEPTRAADWQPVEEKQPELPAAPEPVIIYSPPLEERVPEPPAPPPVVPQEPEPIPMPEAKPKPAKKVSEAAPPPAPETYQEPVTRRGTGMLTMPVDPILGGARNELTRGNIPGALETYGKLIKKGRFLDEVIHDLREALYRYPVEVNIWQSLGDAYMRANRLQDALDAYTKAEELLR